jgi:hypothetical protein
MSFNPTTPITGAAVTGLTSPTFTIASDSNPSQYGKQWYVSALGGTQAGVIAHSVASPFTLSAFRPANLKVLAPVNPTTGQLRSVPVNTYKWLTRKGVLPLVGQASKPSVLRTEWDVPAGADLADANSLRSQLSAHIGLLTQVLNGMADTALTGTI